MSCEHCVLIWWQIGQNVFHEHDVTVMHAELPARRERVNKRVLVRENAAFLRLDQMHHLRLLAKLAA